MMKLWAALSRQVRQGLADAENHCTSLRIGKYLVVPRGFTGVPRGTLAHS